MLDKNVVLIADKIEEFTDIDLKNKNLECIPPKYFNEIFTGLSSISKSVIHYNSPAEFCNNISKHKNDIVLSVWSGVGTKYRKSLVPSICEANKICYVGADPYVHFLCQDKYLTKCICSLYNLKSPKCILYHTTDDIKKLKTLSLPLVVKPNSEGGSNGISQQNLVYTYEDAIHLANEMLNVYDKSILIEEYVAGKEICVSIIGNKRKIDMMDASQLIINGESFFKSTLYGYEAKIKEVSNRHLEQAIQYLTIKQKQIFEKIYFDMGKVELLRIDGRIDTQGNFNLIELTPDAYLGKRGSTTFCAQNNGINYEKMLEMLLGNAYSDYIEGRVQY